MDWLTGVWGSLEQLQAVHRHLKYAPAVLTALAVLATLASVFVGNRVDALKLEREQAARTQLKGEVAQAQRDLHATREELDRKTREIRELATRDVYKPLRESIQDRVVRQLKALAIAQKVPQQITLQLHNTFARNSQEFMNKFQEILRNLGVAFDLSQVTGTTVGASGAWVIFFAPDAEARVLAFVDALKSYITTQPRLEKRNDFPPGGVEIVLSGPAEFNPDGSIVLR